MKHFTLILFSLLLTAHAQTVAPTKPPIPDIPVQAAPFLPDSWMGAGAAWNQNSKPEIAGWASMAKLISAKGLLYSFTSWDITSSKTRPYTAQTSVRSGVAPLVRQFGRLSILGLVDAGMATPVGSLAGAFSGGGIGIVRLGNTNYTLELAVRVIKISGQQNTLVYEFGIGRTSE